MRLKITTLRLYVYFKVIQQRNDGSVAFNRTWQEYKDGFGNLDEFWLGNNWLFTNPFFNVYVIIVSLFHLHYF